MYLGRGMRANGATGLALFLRSLRSGTRWRICSRRCDFAQLSPRYKETTAAGLGDLVSPLHLTAWQPGIGVLSLIILQAEGERDNGDRGFKRLSYGVGQVVFRCSRNFCCLCAIYILHG